MVFLVPADQSPALLSLFPDLPQNVHSRYFLTKKLCQVYLTGNLSNPTAAVIRPRSMPSELFGYLDPNSIFKILQSLKNWQSILVENDISEKLRQLLSQTRNTRSEKEIYLVLKSPVTTLPTNPARLLTMDDLSLLQSASTQFKDAGFPNSYQEILTDGVGAGIVTNNELVSIAHCTHITEKFADIGIFTAPDHRNKGCSTSAAELLIQELLAKNLTPVWSTDEHNLASLKVAQKLGFTQTYTKTYINILQDQQPNYDILKP